MTATSGQTPAARGAVGTDRSQALLLVTRPEGDGTPPELPTVEATAREALGLARAQATRAWFAAVQALEGDHDGLSREAQLDLSRRVETARCVSEAIRRHVAAQSPDDRVDGGPDSAPRVVVAHGLGWFAERLKAALTDRGAQVVSRLEDGADALGVTIAEQPDLVVLQDVMVRLPAETVLTELRRFAPHTVIAVQVEGSARAQVLHDVGAHAPFARTLPPDEVAGCLLDVLAATEHLRVAGDDPTA